MSKLVQDATGNDLTYRIIGAAMAVHNVLGPGYKEEVYEQALAAELQQRQISVSRQHALEVVHADVPVALFYLDLLIEQTVVVEVKAFSHMLTNDERAQLLNYLKAAAAPVGLLFNFGRRSLEYQRIFPPVNRPGPVQRTGRDHVLRSTRSAVGATAVRQEKPSTAREEPSTNDGNE
jgi:GxxExxY protein